MVWGGRRLADVLGKALPTNESYGESWEVSDHPLHYSEVVAGPEAGRTLRSLMEQNADALLGPTHADEFPWLVKFLDADDWLSVQVHPDEPAVRRLLPGEGSKTEAWFIIDAAPGSRIFAGLQPGTDEARLRAALAAGTVTQCLHSFEPRPGDCVFLPAGTVHAVGGGVLMAEVQQTSDATFRLFDWNRRDSHGQSRPLHIEESMASIHWSRGPVTPVHAAGYQDVRAGGPAPTRRRMLVECRYFHLEYLQASQPFSMGGAGRLQALVVLAGRGHWVGGDDLRTGQTWLLPASSPAIECRPDQSLALLLVTMP